MNIAYLAYKQIDKAKWDNCIEGSVNGLIYARSFYLDAMAENWDAIVGGEYEMVMPLTWKTKWGIRYLYQPAFIQQGGVFCRYSVDKHLLNAMLAAAFEEFKFAEFTLNYFNETTSCEIPFETGQRNNFILDLTSSYKKLFENYDPSFTKSLRRIKKFELKYTDSDDYKKIIHLYKRLYGSRLSYFSEKDFSCFENICARLSQENNLVVRECSKNDELLAAVVLLRDGKRLYNMISCVTEAGKKLEANYFLYDHVIKEFAGTNIVLDLEGSDVPGIEKFYRKFNPHNQPYPYIRYNNLHPFIRLFKP